jgi:hypothetical protein
MTERRSTPARETELLIASTWDGRPLDAAEQVRVRLRLDESALRIAIRAPFHGDPPPPGPPGSTERLWEHEVVELFVAGPPRDDGTVRYTEVEISPRGHHLVLQLSGVRRVVASGLPIRLRTLRTSGHWLASARLDRGLLPPPPWSANAFAIHGAADERRYLAAHPLPGPAPDFHQPARFPSLALAEPRSTAG